MEAHFSEKRQIQQRQNQDNDLVILMDGWHEANAIEVRASAHF